MPTSTARPPHAAPKAVKAASTRVLVADDDPASCRFLADGLRSLGALVETCMTGTAALQLARAETFGLLLLDCRMPGAGALEILAQLQDEPQAASATAVAVATSADVTPGDRQTLLAAGFSEVLLKPCSVAELREVLALAPAGAHELLDDGAALISSGDDATMRALRQLLHEELNLLLQELDGLHENRMAFAERLHRLRSSCGFCGATALAVHAATLQRQLERQPATMAALARFRHVVLATRQALAT